MNKNPPDTEAVSVSGGFVLQVRENGDREAVPFGELLLCIG